MAECDGRKEEHLCREERPKVLQTRADVCSRAHNNASIDYWWEDTHWPCLPWLSC